MFAFYAIALAFAIVVVLFTIYRLFLVDRGVVVVPPVVFTELRHDHVIPDQLYRRMQSDVAAHQREFSARVNGRA